MTIKIANPQVLIDDEPFFIKSGTGEYTPGTPEWTTMNELSGVKKRAIHAADFSAAYGVVKFEFENTKENIDKYIELATTFNEHTVAFVGIEDDGTEEFDVSIENAILANRATINLSTDGSLELIFNGDDTID